MRPASDPIATVQAAYAMDGSPSEWLTRVSERVCPVLDRGIGTAAFFIDSSGETELRYWGVQVCSGSDALADLAHAVNSRIDAPLARKVWGRTAPIVSGRAFAESAPRHAATQAAREGLREVGARDFVFMVANDPTGRGVVFASLVDQQVEMSERAREHWGRVATHVAAGLRLRTRYGASPDEPDAVFDPKTARLVHAAGEARDASAREALRASAIAMDRARGRLRRDDSEEALDIWRGLVDGRWSLIDRFDSDGRRYVIARRNDPGVVDPRALTPRERQVVGWAAQGHPDKIVAYAMGISESAVASHISSAARKLGARSRADLVHLARGTDPPDA